MSEVSIRDACDLHKRSKRSTAGLAGVDFGLDRLLRGRGGNISMMYALIAPVLVFERERRSTMAGPRKSTRN